MPDAYLAGKQGNSMIGATSYSFEEWVAAMSVVQPDITNFTSGGFQALLNAIVSAKITLDGPYNSGNMPFVVATTYTWLLGFTSMLGLSIPGPVANITPTVNARKEQRIRIEANSSGTFTAAIT